ncbi:MFS transporter [Carboxydochorda subterranea]|uniref:MFS transporter n=1 Tax=Carboxydichorda subterranea TaxID=3109565 RepID=A0ABZ1BWS4_9FIRM|nr:MFS transporter [Limnochorda sp. L945t]WRP17259.1 MFS transporter [Limnochorda sp. L945t]
MSTSHKLAYSIGSLGASLPYQVMTAYIVFYYVDVLKVSPVTVATAMFLWSWWNAFNDPLLGYLSDRTRTRWGRRIPYIAAGWLPFVVAFYVLWAPPEAVLAAGNMAVFWYFFGVMCLFDFLYTMVVLNWTALFPEMFPRLEERSSVSAMRQAFTLLGLVGVAVASTLAGSIGWDRMGLLFGVIGGIALATSLLGAREDPRYAQAQSLPLLEALRSTLVNRSFVTFALVSFSVQLTFSLIMAAVPFYTKYVLGLPPLGNTLVLLSTFGVIAVALPLWARRTVAVGPRRTMIEGVTLYLITLGGFWFASDLATGIAAGALVGTGIAAAMLLLDVLIADVIDEDELRTGQRREGMYFGMHALILRLNGTAQAAILGLVLARSGYDATLAVQPPSAILGFKLLVTAVPAVILLITLFFLQLYPLHGERLRLVREQLERRRPGAPSPEATPSA